MNFTRWIRTSVMTCSSKPTSRLISSSHASPRQVPAEWLRRVLEDCTEPPRLYAWTLANLSDGDASSRSDKAPAVAAGTRQRDDERRRIYILGIGNIGRLYATFLAKNADRPPITLVVHRKELLEHWRSDPGIELVRAGKPERNANFDIEWWTEAKPTRGPIEEPASSGGSGDGGGTIYNLVVATKAADALPQVDRLRRYLDGGSTVAFTQNGMCKLWPPLGDAYVSARFPPGAAPDWLACVTTHGVTSLGPFRSVHASPANVLVGNISARGGPARPSDYLAGQIVAAPGLATRRVDTRELWVAQLEKLVVNAVINPLTAVLRRKNGELFAQEHNGEAEDGVPVVIDLLLEEASRTLRALVAHPGSDGILQAPRPPADGEEVESANETSQVGEASEDEALERVRDELLARFSFERLRAMLYGVAAKVGENTSSMLQDVRAGKETEIRDFNGWLVETARYVGGDGKDARLPAHERLVQLVLDGKALTRGEMCRELLGDKGDT